MLTQSTSGSPEALTLILVRQSGRAYRANRLATGSEVTSRLQSIARLAIDSLASNQMRQYDPDDEQEEGTLIQVPGREVFDHDLIDKMRPGVSLPLIEADEKWHRRLHCYAVVLQDLNGQIITLVRKTNPIQLVSKSLVTRLFGSHLDRIEEPILAFDDRFDVIIRGDDVIALNKVEFERLFRSSPVVLEKVDDWMSISFGELGICAEELEGFKDRVSGNSYLLRKLQSVARKKYASPVTIDALKDLAVSHQMDVELLFSEGRVNLTSKTERDILSLLNEDVFHGPLSMQSYVASRKMTRSQS